MRKFTFRPKKEEVVEMYCIVCGALNKVPKKDFDDGRYGRCIECLASDCGY